MGCGALGAYSAAEASKGRYMRAPDGHADTGNADFEAFAAAGEVETGKPEIETNVTEEKPAKRPAGRPSNEPKGPPAADPEQEDVKGEEGEEGDEDEDEDEDEKPTKAPRKTSDRIKELTGKNRSQGRLIEQLSTRLEAIEKGGLPSANSSSNSSSIGDAPNPSDLDRYPLGHLDDRYIEDKLDWLATTKAAGQADAVLQRQQEAERNAKAETARAELLDKVDDLSTRGSDQFDDFQEAVVEAGMRGDWRLDQPTFEAAHEADNGAQILYELSQDKKEAARVAGLSSYGQLKFVAARDAEIGKTKQPRRIPRAGEPPATQTRGANSRTRISPSTDNLDDFEKAWAADAKGK